MNTHKICTKCKELKPLGDFSPNKKGKFGKQARCKKCLLEIAKNIYWADPEATRKKNRVKYLENLDKRRESSRKNYWKNRSKRIEEMRKYYYENHQYHLDRVSAYKKEHKKEIAEYMAQWRIDNQEYIREYEKKYREENKAIIKQRAKEWNDANPQMNSIYQHIRRARVEGGGGSYSDDEWFYLLELCGYKCLVCGRDIVELKKLNIPMTQDHIIPVSRMGSSFITNIQPLCKPCNSSKHDKAIDHRTRFIALEMEKLITTN